MLFLKILIGWFIVGFFITILAGVGGLIIYYIFSLGGFLVLVEVLRSNTPDGKEQDRQERIRDEEIANQYIEIDYLNNFDD